MYQDWGLATAISPVFWQIRRGSPDRERTALESPDWGLVTGISPMFGQTRRGSPDRELTAGESPDSEGDLDSSVDNP